MFVGSVTVIKFWDEAVIPMSPPRKKQEQTLGARAVVE